MKKGTLFPGLAAALLLWCFAAAGQGASSRSDAAAAAKAHILGLQEGTLIVRLPANASKQEALQSLISNPATTEGDRWRYERMLTETKAETREFNMRMYQAFQEAYQFSEVLFMYNTSTAALKNGQEEGLFLNENLEPDSTIRLVTPPFYVLRFGSTKSGYSDGLEAMVIMNSTFEDLQGPFPYYQRLNDFEAFMGSIFPGPNQKEKDALRLVGKLNEKLFLFLRRVQ